MIQLLNLPPGELKFWVVPASASVAVPGVAMTLSGTVASGKGWAFLTFLIISPFFQQGLCSFLKAHRTAAGLHRSFGFGTSKFTSSPVFIQLHSPCSFCQRIHRMANPQRPLFFGTLKRRSYKSERALTRSCF